jgi:hypothetical protein
MSKSTGKPRSSYNSSAYHRRLVCEALEDRRMLSVASLPSVLSDASSDVAASALPSQASYMIITTSAIKSHSSKLAAFVAHKEAQGYSVAVATEANWGGGKGNSAADNIHDWLQSHYTGMGIQYVLLIGNPDPTQGDVPMKSIYLSDTDPDYPTDYYYSALTFNWDADGDGRYGEWGNDFSGKLAPEQEVLVGRIPVYSADYTSLDKILAKTISYQDSLDTAWRMSVLLSIAQTNHGSVGPYDFSFGEAIKNQIAIPDGFSVTTLYEQQGTDATTVPIAACDVPLTDQNLLSEWDDQGIVVVRAHGNAEGVVRTVWNDDGDLTPEANEISSPALFESDEASLLDDKHPAIVILDSCNTGCPEDSSNLAYSLLQNGAVAVYSATRIISYDYYSGYFNAATSQSNGDDLAYAYYICKNIADNPSSETVADALYDCRDLWYWESGDYICWKNAVAINLYGDPTTTLLHADYPLTASATTPSSPQSRDVTISYVLTGNATDSCSIEVQYSTDRGATWQTATVGFGGDGTTGLSSNPCGTSHTFVWASGSDIPDPNDADVAICITPSDAEGAGTSCITDLFTLCDSAIQPTLSIDDVTLAEGNSGTKTFTFIVGLTETNGLEVSVSYATVDGTATAGSDYTAASGTLTWAAGDASPKTVSVTVSGDTSNESDETFSVNLSENPSSSNVTISKSTGVGTIQNDDSRISDVVVAESAAPKNGRLESNEVLKIVWTASNPNRIATQVVRIDGKKVSSITKTGSRYSCLTGKCSVGDHQYSITVTDTKGVTSTSKGTFTVLTPIPPVIADVAVSEANKPKNSLFESNEKLKITWTASSQRGIASQVVRVDNKKITTAITGRYSCVMGTFAVGTHTYTIRSFDPTGVSAISTGTFTVQAPIPPVIANAAVVEASSPTSGLLEPNVNLKLVWTASSQRGIVSQIVKINGKKITPIKGSGGKYSCVIGKYAAGDYEYWIKATDPKGVSAICTGTFTVAVASIVDVSAEPVGNRQSASVVAARRAALLTAVMNEMGHASGYDSTPDDDLMEAMLPLATRRAIDAVV